MEQDIFECDEFPETVVCEECGGPAIFMGSLGKTDWFRCRDCGWEQAGELEEVVNDRG